MDNRNMNDKDVEESNINPYESVSEPIRPAPTSRELEKQDAPFTNKGRQISDSEGEEEAIPVRMGATSERRIPGYMKGTRASIALSNEIRKDLDNKNKRHVYKPREGPIVPVDLSHAPNYMRQTMSFVSLAKPKEPSYRPISPQLIKPVDKSNTPRYMAITEAYKKKVEKEPPKRKAEIKEVDTSCIPRYMKTTQVYDKKVEKIVKEARVIKPERIKEVDKSHIPRYMQTTQVYEKKIEKEEKTVQMVSPRMIKDVKEQGEIPSYMKTTMAYEKKVEKEEAKPVSAKKMRDVGTGALPSYMKGTKAAEICMKGKEEERKKKEEEKKKRVDEEKTLEEMKKKWEKQREQADLLLFRK